MEGWLAPDGAIPMMEGTSGNAAHAPLRGGSGNATLSNAFVSANTWEAKRRVSGAKLGELTRARRSRRAGGAGNSNPRHGELAT